jgi:hypothetical protein
MKNTNILLAVIMLLLISVNSCTCFCKKGEGNVITKKIQLSEFSEIDIEGQAQVYIEQGISPSIEILIDSNLYQYIKAEVSGKKLKIFENKCIESISDYKVKIIANRFSELDVDGSVKVKSDSLIKFDKLVIQNNGTGDIQLNIDANNLEVETGGSGSLKLIGRALNMDVNIYGAGSLDAYGLQAKEADVKVKDAGSSKIFVSEKFTGDVSGSGNIIYKGNPKKVNTNITGSGTIQSK